MQKIFLIENTPDENPTIVKNTRQNQQTTLYWH